MKKAPKKTAKPAPRKAPSKAPRKAPKKAAKKTAKKTSGRKNPDAATAAAQLYEDFHGRPPKGTTEYKIEREYRDNLAKLGRLISLTAWLDEDNPVKINFTGPVEVCSEPGGNQIYFVGGSQKIDLAELGIEAPESLKDHVFIGPCGDIEYFTKKGFHNFEPTDYTHEFGEEGGLTPMLNYDTLNQLVYLTGGSYQVLPEGIRN